MNGNPMDFKFTVLTSIYQKEQPEYFDKCMQSLWSDQTLKPNEIVLIEDGPLTTELDKLIEKWSSILKDILVVIPLQENVGLGIALNIGLSHCSNEWVFRMDTDDICTSNRFEKQVEYIQNNPEVDILSGQIIEFDGSADNITGKKAVPLTHDDIFKFSKVRSPFNHMAVAYKKSVIQSVGGYQHHLYMEDYNLWLRVLAAGYKSANLKDTLVIVRAGENMVKRRRGKVYIESEWQLFKLKRQLNFQSAPKALLIYIARSAPRLLPSSLLTKLYSKLRHHKSY